MLSETEIVVRYQETDQMGVVHHSVYPIWFECGRTDLIQKAGITYGQLEKDGIMPVSYTHLQNKVWACGC